MVVLVKAGALAEKNVQHPRTHCDREPGHALEGSFEVLVMHDINGRLGPLVRQNEAVGIAPANGCPADGKECTGPILCHADTAPPMS